ncbi:hypothetical protein IPH67_03905 [bacterium]|nr:MAG: hypothetical protein IPH67_03905 [bacterium]
MKKLKIMFSLLMIVNAIKPMDYLQMTYAYGLVAALFSQAHLITQAEQAGEPRLLLVFAENALDTKTVRAGLYKIIIDTCAANGQISEEKLFQFNPAEAVVENTLKPALDKMETAKKLRLVSKELEHMIDIKDVYALEREALKIKLLPHFVANLANWQPAGIENIKGQNIPLKYATYNFFLIPLETVNLLNKYYSMMYQKKYMKQLINENEPNLKLEDAFLKLNNVLFCMSTMAIQCDPVCSARIYFEQNENDRTSMFKDLTFSHTIFTKLSLFLFADHNKGQRGLLPCNVFLRQNENDMQSNIRELLKDRTKVFKTFNSIKLFTVGTVDQKCSDSPTLKFGDCIVQKELSEVRIN